MIRWFGFESRADLKHEEGRPATARPAHVDNEARMLPLVDCISDAVLIKTAVSTKDQLTFLACTTYATTTLAGASRRDANETPRLQPTKLANC